MSTVTTERFKVRAYEVGINGKVSILSLWNFMQEAAWNSATNLGVSVYKLREQGITWVLSRLKLEIDELPAHGEELLVDTWPSGFDRVFVFRDFRIRTVEGREIGRATSTWLVFDIQTRRMQPIPEYFKKIRTSEGPDPLNRASGKLPGIEKVTIKKSFTVRWHDLDLNLHINNALYLQWVLETVPELILKQGVLREIDIQFKKEGGYGIKLASLAEVRGKNLIHQIETEGGEVLVKATTCWR